MFASKTFIFAVVVIVAACFASSTTGIPAIRFNKRFDAMSGIDYIQICLNNCAQCKTMFGNYFQAQNCAEACLRFQGKAIPDCEDIDSIAPYIKKIQ